MGLDCAFGICVFPFSFFFFFCTRLWDCSYCSCTVQWTVSAKFDFFIFFQPISAHRALFMDPQISFFNNFFIKNRSHGTIYTFKNYFAIVFFSFQLYPNGPLNPILDVQVKNPTLKYKSINCCYYKVQPLINNTPHYNTRIEIIIRYSCQRLFSIHKNWDYNEVIVVKDSKDFPP